MVDTDTERDGSRKRARSEDADSSLNTTPIEGSAPGSPKKRAVSRSPSPVASPAKKQAAPPSDEENSEDADSDMNSFIEEDEDEDDDSDGAGKKRKKDTSKIKRNAFIDDMAMVNEDDDDEEDEDDDLGMIDDTGEAAEAEVAARDLHRQRRQQVRPERETESLEEIERQIKERHSHRQVEYQGDTDVVPETFLLPSIDDPKMWAIKCRIGRERDLVQAVMRRMFEREGTATALQIQSIISRDNLKGYLYVEANSMADIQNALSRIQGIYLTKIELVSIPDRPAILKVIPRKNDARPGGWVRITRGKYKGDLGMVLEVPKIGVDVIKVRLVPRLDYTKATSQPSTRGEKGAPKKKQKLPRPAAKLFDPSLVEKSDRTLSKHGQYWTWQGNEFLDGFLEKDLRMGILQFENVQPTLEELATFASSEAGANGVDLPALTQLAQSTALNVKQAPDAAAFQSGETVDIVEGELAGAQAVVQSVNGATVALIPKDLGLTTAIELDISQLRKFFAVGDHVRVMAGKYKGQSGMVVSTSANTISIFDNITQTNIEVFKRDVKFASEADLIETSTKWQAGNTLFTLASSQQKVAIITKVEFGALKVLDEDGTEKIVREDTVLPGTPASNRGALDAYNNPVFDGSMVQIIKGEFLGIQAQIKLITEDAIFISSRDITRSNGITVVKRDFIALIGGNTLIAPSMGARLNSSMPASSAAVAGPLGSAHSATTAGRGMRDPLIQKEVKIISGPHKGMFGTVRDRSGDNLRILMTSSGKMTTVHKDRIKLTQPLAPMTMRTGGYGGDMTGGRTPGWAGDGGRTPGFGVTPGWTGGAQTPFLGGAKTPGYGGAKTPAYGGAKTPAYGGGARTPGYGGAKTPAYGGGAQTPAYGGGQTPAHFGARTPAHGAATPHWGMTGAATPAYQPHVAATPSWQGATQRASGAGQAAGGQTPAWSSSMPTQAAYGGAPAGDYNYSAISETPEADSFLQDMQGTEAVSEEEAWPIENMMVRILPGMHWEGGKFDNAVGYIVWCTGARLRIVLPDSASPQEQFQCAARYLEPVVPDKKDEVIIFRGESRGARGILYSVDGDDIIVKMSDTQEYKVVTLTDAAKAWTQ